MLINTLDKEVIDNYCLYLKCAGMLSGLSSESDSPYINSRTAVNTFCLVTGAENLWRADCSADAKMGDIGISIKTFLAGNNLTVQKVAEFNKDAIMISNKSTDEIVAIIAKLRNERLLSTMRIYGIKNMIYHCIVRESGVIKICEYPMESINIENITEIEVKNDGNSVGFKDGKNEYTYNLNRNTLFMRFDTKRALYYVTVDILDAPDKLLACTLNDDSMPSNRRRIKYQSIILPLFSDKGRRHIPEKSGLNQWNSAGRVRHMNEMYIPIPAWIHRCFPGFFPARDKIFDLNLPDGSVLAAKACQQGSKALMSNPNLELGRWLLREVMNLEEGILLTYEQLQVLGVDSVEVYKYNDKEYKIDFRSIGTYDEFFDKYFRKANSNGCTD